MRVFAFFCTNLCVLAPKVLELSSSHLEGMHPYAACARDRLCIPCYTSQSMATHELILSFEAYTMSQISNDPFSDAIASSHLSLPLVRHARCFYSNRDSFYEES